MGRSGKEDLELIWGEKFLQCFFRIFFNFFFLELCVFNGEGRGGERSGRGEALGRKPRAGGICRRR